MPFLLSNKMITADKISKGITYKIVEISECDAKARMIDMSCIPGTLITKLFVAPFGDPVAYWINGSFILSVRLSEAKNIIVKEIS